MRSCEIGTTRHYCHTAGRQPAFADSNNSGASLYTLGNPTICYITVNVTAKVEINANFKIQHKLVININC